MLTQMKALLMLLLCTAALQLSACAFVANSSTTMAPSEMTIRFHGIVIPQGSSVPISQVSWALRRRCNMCATHKKQNVLRTPYPQLDVITQLCTSNVKLRSKCCVHVDCVWVLTYQQLGMCFRLTFYSYISYSGSSITPWRLLIKCAI